MNKAAVKSGFLGTAISTPGFTPAIFDNLDYTFRQAPHTFKRGEFIYFPNEASNKVYVVDKGRVKVCAYSPEGKEVIQSVVQKGEIFGELSLIGEDVRGEYAQAMEATTVYILPLHKAEELMHDNRRFRNHVTLLLGKRLIKTQRRLESLIFKDARSRVIEFLTDLAHEKGRPVGYETLVPRFFTHHEIANLTGTSRQTVTTVLNDLRQQNMIYFDRRRLLIRDVEKLAALIE